MTTTTMESKARQLVAEFIVEEYADETETIEDVYALMNDPKEIGIAYTQSDKGDDIQVMLNLEDYKISTYINGELAHENTYSTLDKLIQFELEHLNFDSLVSDYL